MIFLFYPENIVNTIFLKYATFKRIIYFKKHVLQYIIIIPPLLIEI